jgi:hypothetical protein
MFVLFYFRLVKPQYLVPFLQPGRLVRVKQADKDFGFGVVINFKKKAVKVTVLIGTISVLYFTIFIFIYERESFLISFFISSKKIRPSFGTIAFQDCSVDMKLIVKFHEKVNRAIKLAYLGLVPDSATSLN